jgi:hypothetical protein
VAALRPGPPRRKITISGWSTSGARTQLERALQISEQALGPDHPDIGTFRNNLGSVRGLWGIWRGRARSSSAPFRLVSRPWAPTTPTSPSGAATSAAY